MVKRINNYLEIKKVVDDKQLSEEIVNSDLFDNTATTIYNNAPSEGGARERLQKFINFLSEALPIYSEIYNKSYLETFYLFEKKRNVIPCNWFKKDKFPLKEKIHIYKNKEDFYNNHLMGLFKCPSCKKSSKNAYRCDDENCGYSINGLIVLDGIYILLTDNIEDIPVPQKIFKPIDL